MKKLMVVVSVLTLSFAAVGCKDKAKEGEEAAKPAEPAPAPTPTPAPTTPPAAEPAKTETPPAGGAAATGVPECDEYIAAVEKLMTCDKIPQAARDAQKQGLDAMKQGWSTLADPNTPPEAKKAAADGCKTAVDAVKQSASAAGC
jgi:hypothetical protein